MRTRKEVEIAARRAHSVAKFLVDVGGVQGSPASVKSVLKWYDEATAKGNNSVSFESGLIKLTVDREWGGEPWFRVYVNTSATPERAAKP